MNRIMLLGLLVCISRVALCGVMGVMAETVARRAGSSSLRGLGRRHRRGEIQLHRTLSFLKTEHTKILPFGLQENVRSPVPPIR